MNRETRRKLQRATRKYAGATGVLLHGGPMDGWYVKPDAPALSDGWGLEHGGAYVLSDVDAAGIPQAQWMTRQEVNEARYFTAAAGTDA